MTAKTFIALALLVILLSPMVAAAHPGRTDRNGCHVCRANCGKWGLSYGEYHCHGRR